MRVCFVVSQLFAWGKYGGFGSLTRMLGRELVKRGVEVFAVVPRRAGQHRMETLDGIRVLGFPQWTLGLGSRQLYASCSADVYHSEEPSSSTWIAMKAMPNRKHVVTCQDPRDTRGWLTHFRYEAPRRKLYFPATYLFEENYFTTRAVRNADAVHCQAKCVTQKAQAKYGLSQEPGFLPNPVEVPTRTPRKAKRPTVCFLGRWDRIKRPEIFLELAKHYPKVRFIALGSSEDRKWDTHLRTAYRDVSNLEMTGFVDQFSDKRLWNILEESWVMINTSAIECLPVSFLEAAAYRCAILSFHNPDGFAQDFGYHVKNGQLEQGLDFLLSSDEWRPRGEAGYEYVNTTHEVSVVIDRHLNLYEAVLEENRLAC